MKPILSFLGAAIPLLLAWLSGANFSSAQEYADSPFDTDFMPMAVFHGVAAMLFQTLHSVKKP